MPAGRRSPRFAFERRRPPAVRRGRAALRRPSGRLHAHRPARAAAGRRGRHGLLELVDHEPAVSPLALSRAQREEAAPPAEEQRRRAAVRCPRAVPDRPAPRGLRPAVAVGLVAVVVGGVLDIAETGSSCGGPGGVARAWGWRRSWARPIASTELWPEGQVRIAGEIWQARCQGGATPGRRSSSGRSKGSRSSSTPPRRAWRSGPRSRGAAGRRRQGRERPYQ